MVITRNKKDVILKGGQFRKGQASPGEKCSVIFWQYMRTVNPLEGGTKRLNNWKEKVPQSEKGKQEGRERKLKACPGKVSSFPRFKSEFVFVWKLLEFDENLKPPVSFYFSAL